MPNGGSHESELRKELGVWDLVLTQILFIVGLPWIGVAAKLGPSHVALWLAAIVAFYIPTGMVVIWLNTRWPHEGGLYLWARSGFNNFIGFMVAWNLWLYVIVLSSETGLQVTTNLAYALGPGHEWLAGSKPVITVISATTIGFLVVISIVGLGVGKWFHNAGGFTLVVIFLAIVFFGMRSPGFHPFHLVMPAASVFSLNILARMGFGALGGFEYVAILAGECRNPVRSIRRSVLIAAPIIAAMFILGTASMLALVPIDKIDLIGPVAQVLSVGGQPYGLAAGIVPIAIVAVMLLRIAQASVNFTGNTRLPMVAGWDRLLPQWFTELHPRFRTPVNSILLTGGLILVMGLVSLIGVGHQESFQLLWNGAIVFYAIPYVIMFLIPLCSRKVGRVGWFLRIAAFSGLVMTLLDIFFSAVPIIEVKSQLSFTLKIALVGLAGNALGIGIYALRGNLKNAAAVACVLVALLVSGGCRQTSNRREAMDREAMDRDLMETTIPQLQRLYASHKYTVTEVVRWYQARVEKYNGIYRAVQNLDMPGALATAAREDAAAKAGGNGFVRGPLWGVPIVTKANTSVAGLVTTDGWKGYTIPGHELIAPKDATIVAKLRAAGAVILGQTNMPDFAASDTNRSTAYGRTGNAYDVRFSPGGSSGGTVTAVTANFAMLGNGTDTGNSIRMPSATSSVVGVFPTRGLVSIAGIAPLDWLLDNTGPIARNVTDAAIALGVMTGEDPLDPPTIGSKAKAQPGPYTQYLKADALKGKRFGVPAFVLSGAGVAFQGIVASASPRQVAEDTAAARVPLTPETRTAFLKALDGLRAAGATIVFDDSLLPDSFAATVTRVGTLPYVREGTEKFLAQFGPSQYHSAAEYAKAVGSPLPATIAGGADPNARKGRPPVVQAVFESDARAEANVSKPRRTALAAYNEALDRLHLDGLVYPATQMPPPDETMAQDNKLSEGPHSATGWVNMIGVPAVVVPGGFYPSGLPFGLELSARLWRDGDLLGWAYAYERATLHRKPPVLVEKGLLPNAR